MNRARKAPHVQRGGNILVTRLRRIAPRTSWRSLTAVAALTVAACCSLAAPASGAPGEYLYWPNGFLGESIARANVDGTGLNLGFITGGTNAFRAQNVAVDDKYLFWANEARIPGTIGRANLDGSAANVDFITMVERPYALAVDGRHVYWGTLLHGIGGAIGRANVDGTGLTMDFITTPGGPRGLAVDGRHIYWTTNSTIGRANLDGSNVDQSFIGGTSPGRGMAVEAPYLYWVTSSGIGRASIDGTGVDESFIPSADTHSGVAVNAQHVFWGVAHESLGGSSIGRANLDGTGVDPSFITGATFPRGLAVSFQPLPPNVPTLGVTPPKLDFGSQPVSTLSPPSVLTVSNTGTAPLKISSVRVSTGDVDEFLISRDTCTNSTLPIDGAPCVIGVRFGPTASGPRSATLRIVSNDPASPRQVALSGIGAGCAGQKATIVGTRRPDKLPGTKRDDVIVARGGDDRVFGVKGDDLICGGGGADVIRGMRGADKLRGGRGKDKLRGGRARDRCRGGGGSDRRHHC